MEALEVTQLCLPLDVDPPIRPVRLKEASTLPSLTGDPRTMQRLRMRLKALLALQLIAWSTTEMQSCSAELVTAARLLYSYSPGRSGSADTPSTKKS